MKIEAVHQGGGAQLRLEGRLDHDGAERLASSLEALLQDGVRSLTIDLSGVTYLSSPATAVLKRWSEELAVLRGDVRLTSVSPAAREGFNVAGWDPDATPDLHAVRPDLRHSSWQLRADLAANGQYEVSSTEPGGTLRCRLHGDPEGLTRVVDDCSIADFSGCAFGLGIGAIGGSFEQCHERFGELIAAAGCLAYFPTDGARLPDYLIGSGSVAPRAGLVSGLTCEGGFAKLVRFTTRPQTNMVPLSELGRTALGAVRSKVAGVVIAGEAAGLCGTRLLRSPGYGGEPMRFQVPVLREWLSFAPERTHPVTTTLIVGVVAQGSSGPLARYLRPLDRYGLLYGHFHAAVFSYNPLPQRTVELGDLVRGLFRNQQLRDILHLVWDDREDAGVGESGLVRGVAWVAPITQVG